MLGDVQTDVRVHGVEVRGVPKDNADRKTLDSSCGTLVLVLCRSEMAIFLDRRGAWCATGLCKSRDAFKTQRIGVLVGASDPAHVVGVNMPNDGGKPIGRGSLVRCVSFADGKIIGEKHWSGMMNPKAHALIHVRGTDAFDVPDGFKPADNPYHPSMLRSFEVYAPQPSLRAHRWSILRGNWEKNPRAAGDILIAPNHAQVLVAEKTEKVLSVRTSSRYYASSERFKPARESRKGTNLNWMSFFSSAEPVERTLRPNVVWREHLDEMRGELDDVRGELDRRREERERAVEEHERVFAPFANIQSNVSFSVGALDLWTRAFETEIADCVWDTRATRRRVRGLVSMTAEACERTAKRMRAVEERMGEGEG